MRTHYFDIHSELLDIMKETDSFMKAYDILQNRIAARSGKSIVTIVKENLNDKQKEK